MLRTVTRSHQWSVRDVERRPGRRRERVDDRGIVLRDVDGAAGCSEWTRPSRVEPSVRSTAER